MNKPIGVFIFTLSVLFYYSGYSQEPESANNVQVSELFLGVQTMPIKLSYSIKDLKKETNDSTYIDSKLSYKLNDDTWKSLEIELRARGNYRLKNCYFPPLKVKIKKSDSKDTPFEGNKSLKMVLPCLVQRDNNDNVVKEYLAYKLFELISPYHFKTRLLDVDLENVKRNSSKSYNLKGFFIEDDKTVAKRLEGKVYERKMHPLSQEPVASIRNALFQYMIGNTDFSQAYQHNVKVIYIDKEMVPIPYDFDMSGFVNTSYAVVSVIPGERVALESVTQRKYRGFVRDEALFEQVRQEFIKNKKEMFSLLDSHEHMFENADEFSIAREYLSSFFEVMVNNEKFKTEIVNSARKE
ncbi:hypothetical protein NA63_1592 [Flavobacteriaceae bacterium MAR_2010_105]|nr:hypothetical protein NA63_1592 [Flavobacteriaceae bacterium MAR_2010_105]